MPEQGGVQIFATALNNAIASGNTLSLLDQDIRAREAAWEPLRSKMPLRLAITDEVEDLGLVGGNVLGPAAFTSPEAQQALAEALIATGQLRLPQETPMSAPFAFDSLTGEDDLFEDFPVFDDPFLDESPSGGFFGDGIVGGIFDTVGSVLGGIVDFGTGVLGNVLNNPAAIGTLIGNLIRDEPERPMGSFGLPVGRPIFGLPVAGNPCSNLSGVDALLCALGEGVRTTFPATTTMVDSMLAPGTSEPAPCLGLLGSLNAIATQDKPARSAYYKELLRVCGAALTPARKTSIRKLLKLTTKRRTRCAPKRKACAPRRRSCATKRRVKKCGSGCPPKRKPCRKTKTQAAFARLARQYGGRIPKGARLR